jgi:hypothetical protein
VGKELEMLASGCRRARIALEWGKYQDAHPTSTPRELDALRERFRAALQAETKKQAGDICVFGAFSPEPHPVACPFAGGPMRSVFQKCRDTVDRELGVPDLKLSPRLFRQRRKV